MGLFRSLSERELSRLILVANGAGLGSWRWRCLYVLWPGGPIATAFIPATTILGISAFALGLATAAVKWHVLAFQRKPLASIPLGA
jgi:hypothetical protein